MTEEKLKDLISQMGHEDWQYKEWHEQLEKLQRMPDPGTGYEARKKHRRRVQAFKEAGFDPERKLPDGFHYINGLVMTTKERKAFTKWMKQTREGPGLPTKNTAAFLEVASEKLRSIRASAATGSVNSA